MAKLCRFYVVSVILIAALAIPAKAGTYVTTSGTTETLLYIFGGPHPYGGDIVPGANLYGADLTNANLSGADLSSANLRFAKLYYTYLTGADLFGTDLRDAYLSGVRSGGIIGTPLALPANWQLTNGYLIGPGADLYGADLTNANLSGADLSSANLSNADLSGADLFRANLSSADLTNANLSSVDLFGAYLTDAYLFGVRSGGILGTPSYLPTDWQLTNGYLIGPEADLSNADLSNANLFGAHLFGANLSGAVLTGADLRGADLRGADLTGSVLTGADLNGVIWGSSSLGGVLSAKIITLETQLANEYTLEEIADLRPGSSIIEVVGGQATMNFRVQESDNMVDWFDTAETSDVTLPAPDPGKKFFRFAGPE